jgi:hypothetical protein
MTLTREIAKQYVGKGWGSLIDEIFDMLPRSATVVDIKEKFGGLRIEVSCIALEYIDRIEEIEEKSKTMCDVCGAPGFLIEVPWLKTRCAKHIWTKPCEHTRNMKSTWR